ncbi:cell division protein FtsQ/DivIB [Moraxella bovis]|nr:cell division protein FtsQ/DivIB [Moraxella bovis]UYZ88829.1 cell division protein FtsQ/DivIB [Moraxella bovis]UYZ96011.1 cell division protein FtsQ/DivIB [Moraxella bovis]UZA06857.1 cell division protein FtsQ/DivIB [Moraxella bovis]UZA10915.1 cell division protein FtsQ/DivIB [Moraxella bovis]UZA17296.1 cell division protein FtsQ/DivIB [Moraxella bovis]
MAIQLGATVAEMTADHINHEHEGHDDKHLSKSWQSALVTLGLMFAIGFFAMQTIGKSPAKPIHVEASNLTTPENQSLMQAIAPFGETPFFGGNLHQIHDSVTSLSWVEHATVRRDWYQGITVEAVPRKPIANFGSQEMIDANGVVFRPADKGDVMNPDLVTLHGSATQADAIMRQMQYVNQQFAPLGLTVDDLILTPRNTWVVRFHNGLRVVVDDENTTQKLHQLAQILNERFAERINDMQSVDLRYKNGFSIAWRNKK